MPKKKETLGQAIGYPGSEPSPQALAGNLAQAYASRMNGESAPAPSPGPSPSAMPMNPHMLAMHQAAEEARRRYMEENGVDENGNPLARK